MYQALFPQHSILKAHPCRRKEHSSGRFPCYTTLDVRYFKSTPGASHVTSPTPTGRPGFRSTGCVQPVFTALGPGHTGIRRRADRHAVCPPELTFLGDGRVCGEVPLLGREDRRGLPEEGAFRPRPENEKSQPFKIPRNGGTRQREPHV